MAELDREDFERRLWKAIDDEKIGMLGLMGPSGMQNHMQPMTAYHEEGSQTVWFFTRRSNDLIGQARDGGGRAMFCLTSGKELWACMSGYIAEQRDQERIDRFWNPVAAAWYPEGKDDPELTLLRFEPDDAQVWVSTKGPVRFAYEVAKANLSKEQPDMGGQAHIRFH